MIYVVAYENKANYTGFVGSASAGLHRHATQYEAQKTLEGAKDRYRNARILPFKNMEQACEWLRQQHEEWVANRKKAA